MWVGVITNAGRALLDSYSAGGHTLSLTGATVGSGIVEEANLRIQTAVSVEKDSASIISAQQTNGGVKYKVQVGPASVPIGAYTAHQIGLWAKLDNGTNTLLMLAQDAVTGVDVPLKTVFPAFAFALFMDLYIDNTDDLTVNIDETAYVTTGTMNERLDDKLDKANVYNGLDKTASGYALDARQGNVLDKRLCFVEESISGITTVGPAEQVNIDQQKAAAAPFRSLYLTIPIEQSGSGTPSPGNVRHFKFNNAWGYEYWKPGDDPMVIPPSVGVLWESQESYCSGIYDLLHGGFIQTHGYIESYDGETLPGMWYSSMDVYSAGATPTIGAEVVYELEEPEIKQGAGTLEWGNADQYGYFKVLAGFSTVTASYFIKDGVLHESDVVDSLTSSATDKPLSAAQGKALNDAMAVAVIDDSFTDKDSHIIVFHARQSGKMVTLSFGLNSGVADNTILFNIPSSLTPVFVNAISPLIIDSSGAVYTNGSVWITLSNRNKVMYYGSTTTEYTVCSLTYMVV